MNFRIHHLFFLTAAIAFTAASFRNDIVLFRELVYLQIVMLFAGIAAWIVRNRAQHQFVLTGNAGSMGGAIYGLLMLWMAQIVYPDYIQPFSGFLESWRSQWTFEISLGPLLGFAIGAATGPMLFLQLSKTELDSESTKSLWISWLLLGANIVIMLFRSMDRTRIGPRDWTLLQLVLITGFIGFTIYWTRKTIYSSSIDIIPTEESNPLANVVPEPDP